MPQPPPRRRVSAGPAAAAAAAAAAATPAAQFRDHAPHSTCARRSMLIPFLLSL